MTLFVIDDSSIHCPIHAAQAPRCQAFLQQGPFSNEGKPVSFLDEGLNLRWMRCTRVVLKRDACIPQQFHEPVMRIGMALWVVNDPQIVLQVGYLEHGFARKRMISAKTDDEPVAPQFFDMQLGMRQRQCNDSCVDPAVKNFVGKLPRIPMGGPYCFCGTISLCNVQKPRNRS